MTKEAANAAEVNTARNLQSDPVVRRHVDVQQASPSLPTSHSSSPSTRQLPQKPPTRSVHHRHTSTSTVRGGREQKHGHGVPKTSPVRTTVTSLNATRFSKCFQHQMLRYGDGAGNTTQENSSVFSLIQMR